MSVRSSYDFFLMAVTVAIATIWSAIRPVD